jgi:hypothetical protein
MLALPALCGNSAEIPHFRMQEQEQEQDQLKTAEFPHIFHVTCLTVGCTGCVCATFCLPEHLHDLHPGPLVYLELFTKFDRIPLPVHLMHATACNRANGQRRAAIVPVADIALACHLAPRFHCLDSDICLNLYVNLLNEGTRFFLNPYYNQYSYLLLQYWRHLECTSE